MWGAVFRAGKAWKVGNVGKVGKLSGNVGKLLVLIPKGGSDPLRPVSRHQEASRSGPSSVPEKIFPSVFLPTAAAETVTTGLVGLIRAGEAL